MAEAVIKRSIASLVGGIAIAIAAMILWILLVGTQSVPLTVLGVIIALAAGVWVRLADL